MLDLTEKPVIVTRKNMLTHNVVELFLQLSEASQFQFSPGQYIQFLFDGTFRSYSMVNLPAESELRFCIKLIPDGLASEFVEKLQVGDTFSIRGPYGDFVVQPNAEQYVFVATSTGIAPICAMVGQLLAQKETKPITILFGVRTEVDIFYFDFFSDLHIRYPHITFIPALTQPTAAWNGFTGRVTQYLAAHSAQFANAQVYICGSQGMVIDAQSIALKSGISKTNIRTEVFN